MKGRAESEEESEGEREGRRLRERNILSLSK